LPAGTSETFMVDASVLQAAAGDGTLIDAPFAVRASGINPLNVLKTVPVQSKTAAQLVLGTAVSPVAPGQTFTYDVDIGQVGATPLKSTLLSLALPPGVSVGTISNAGKASDGVVTWDLGTMAVASTAHLSVDATVADDAVAGSTLFARARLTYAGVQELDAQSELGVSVVAEALPLAVTVGTQHAAATVATSELYTTTITNTSARALDAVRLLLHVPEFQFQYVQDADPDAACGTSVCSTGNEATWSLGSIKAGGTVKVTVNPTITPSLLGGSLLVTRQRLTATALGGSIFLQTTLPVQTM